MPVTAVKNVVIWGNHSSTQYPDVNHGTIEVPFRAGGTVTLPIRDAVKDDAWQASLPLPTYYSALGMHTCLTCNLLHTVRYTHLAASAADLLST